MSLFNIPITNSNDIQKQNSLVNLIESVSNNKLYLYYPEHNSAFIKKIDKLNLSFYIETEKILSRKKVTGTSTSTNNNHYQTPGQGQDTLFLLLFKQINLYIAEIERLNILIKEYEEKFKLIKNETKEEKLKRRNEINTKDQIISTLRTSNTVLETKLLEQIRQSNTLFPSYNKNNINRHFINALNIETFSICYFASKSNYNGNRFINICNNNNNTNDSIIMNGAVVSLNGNVINSSGNINNINAQKNQKKVYNYFNIRYNSKEEKPNETINSIAQKRLGDCIKKKKGMKIIKNVKKYYSQIKVDSTEIQSSERERETNGRINSDITDCNNTIYLKSQRIKQRKLLLDSCKTHIKF